MRILVTNDDGIDSEGLHVLARAMLRMERSRSSPLMMSTRGPAQPSAPLHRIQPEVHQVRVDGLAKAWAVTGPPALCVMFARLGAFGPPFDLVVAGINPGINVGRSVYHSGTVGAALTARAGGISGVAVSQAVRGYGVEGQGWDDMLRGQCGTAPRPSPAPWWRRCVRPAAPPGRRQCQRPEPARDEIQDGATRPSVGCRPRVMAEAKLEPKLGHPGSFRVTMSWGDAVSLPDGTDGGTVERDQVSVTLLSSLSDTRTAATSHAPEGAERAIGTALDALLGAG